MRSPDFLCIGDPKAGSIWLFENLRQHPQIWLPATKSIQYWNGAARSIRRKRLRRHLQNSATFKWSDASIRWNLKYYFSPVVNRRWYLSLFEPREGQICGEVAPAYCAMSAEQAEQVQLFMPDVKIVLILRNPIERIWSHAMHTLVRVESRMPQSISERDLIDYFKQVGQQQKSNYPRTLDIWQSLFPAEQIHLEFFEDIGREPQEVLSRLCQFLDVAPAEKCFAKTAKAVSNKGPGHEPPPAIRQWLAREYFDQLEELSRRFGGYADTWLSDAERNLRQAA